MLWRASALEGLRIAATDGEIGKVGDLLFDDARWGVRWLVADTGGWLGGRELLLPMSALGRPRAEERRLPVKLTRRQVEESPPIARDMPVSRQAEVELYRHYGARPHWEHDLLAPLNVLASGGPQSTGFLFPPDAAAHAEAATAGAKPGGRRAEPAGDRHLQSAHDSRGLAIAAADGAIGHVEDVLVEDAPWAIRYMVVDTRDWLPGRKVLVSPHWIRAIDWAGQRVAVDLTRAQVEASPGYDPSHSPSREDEALLHKHYGRPAYWP